MVVWKDRRSSYECALQRWPFVEGPEPQANDEGYLGWLSRRGAATVQWNAGRACNAWLLEDQQLHSIEFQRSQDDQWRRSVKSPEFFEWCEVTISSNDFRFSPKIYIIPFDFDDFENDLYGDIYHSELKNFFTYSFAFCVSFFEAVNNTFWSKKDAVSGFGWRDLGQFIAHVRQTGHAYTDFLGISREDYELEANEHWMDRKSVHRLIEQIGWRQVAPTTVSKRVTVR